MLINVLLYTILRDKIIVIVYVIFKFDLLFSFSSWLTVGADL